MGKGRTKRRSGSGALGEPREVGKGGGPALKNQCNREWKFCAGVVQKKIQHLHDTATIVLWIGEPRSVTRGTNSGWATRPTNGVHGVKLRSSGAVMVV